MPSKLLYATSNTALAQSEYKRQEPISELIAESKGKPYRLVGVAEGTTTLYD
jgi:hypothetical protein